ncbi:MAG TPA: GNAT family N-acetyltransferase [Dehalococcoidales bacterium]
MDTGEVNISIRPIKKTDYEAVFSLAWDLVTHEDLDALNLGSPTSLCFVAEADGRVVGFNLAHLLHVGIPLSKICIIQGIVVHDDYRRLGIGEKLIEAIIERCIDCGIGTIRALVEESDMRLQQFVEYIDFQRSSVINYDKTLYV